MEKDNLSKKVLEDEDFIYAPKFGNSLNKYLAKMENPPDNSVIGKLLLIPEAEVEKLYQESIIALRKDMVDDDESDF